MSSARTRHPWAIDLTEPDVSAPKVEMPKPPGYSEYHAQELDDNKVAVKKIDMMALKLKVRARHFAHKTLRRRSRRLHHPTAHRRKQKRWPGHPARIL